LRRLLANRSACSLQLLTSWRPPPCSPTTMLARLRGARSLVAIICSPRELLLPVQLALLL